VFTNNDDGHRTAADLHAKGVKIAAVIDTRDDAPVTYDYEVLRGAQVVDTKGRLGLNFVEVMLSDGTSRTIETGALAVFTFDIETWSDVKDAGGQVCFYGKPRELMAEKKTPV